MSEPTLAFEVRTTQGSAECRRMRRGGQVPCVMYGAGKDAVHLAVNGRELDKMLHAGVRIVEMHIGSERQVGLIKDLQYDALGSAIVHADFMRVDRDTPVHIYVPVRFIGAAPTVSGSVVEKILEDIQVEVLPLRIPKEFVVNLSTLKVGAHITIADLNLPEGCKPYHSALTDIVVVNHVRVEKAAPVVEGAGVEPEVIGKKPEDAAAPAAGDKKAEKKTEKKPEKK
jgi:large subunit ribosomal protein L25